MLLLCNVCNYSVRKAIPIFASIVNTELDTTYPQAIKNRASKHHKEHALVCILQHK